MTVLLIPLFPWLSNSPNPFLNPLPDIIFFETVFFGSGDVLRICGTDLILPYLASTSINSEPIITQLAQLIQTTLPQLAQNLRPAATAI